MRILDWKALDEAGRRAALARPALKARADVTRVVLEIIDRVRREGDAAVRALTQRFDSVEIETLAVTEAEFREARRALSPEQIAALERAIENVERFHEAQAPQPIELLPNNKLHHSGDAGRDSRGYRDGGRPDAPAVPSVSPGPQPAGIADCAGSRSPAWPARSPCPVRPRQSTASISTRSWRPCSCARNCNCARI